MLEVTCVWSVGSSFNCFVWSDNYVHAFYCFTLHVMCHIFFCIAFSHSCGALFCACFVSRHLTSRFDIVCRLVSIHFGRFVSFPFVWFVSFRFHLDSFVSFTNLITKALRQKFSDILLKKTSKTPTKKTLP